MDKYVFMANYPPGGGTPCMLFDGIEARTVGDAWNCFLERHDDIQALSGKCGASLIEPYYMLGSDFYDSVTRYRINDKWILQEIKELNINIRMVRKLGGEA